MGKTPSQLRTLIRLLAEEKMPDRVLRRPWHGPVLDAIGAWPLRLLGNGAFGTVYESEMDDGRRVAVKVTDEQREGTNYRRMMDLIKEMPPKVARHFPVIHDIVLVPEAGEDGDPAYGIVLELLTNLPPDIANDLFDTGVDLDKTGVKTRTYSQVYGDPGNVIKAVRHAVKEYNRTTNRDTKPIDQAMARELERFAISLPVDGELPYRLTRQVFKLVGGVKQKYVTVTEEDIERIFEDAFDTSVPYGHDTIPKSKKMWSSNPAATSLARALAFVYGRNIAWSDIKDANLGFRSRTGDIVILDLGLFSKMSPGRRNTT